MTYWILTCRLTGETQEVYTCDEHSNQMPAADGDLVQAYDCDEDTECEFCRDQKLVKQKRAAATRAHQ